MASVHSCNNISRARAVLAMLSVTRRFNSVCLVFEALRVSRGCVEEH
jgi:hypothetical protein